MGSELVNYGRVIASGKCECVRTDLTAACALLTAMLQERLWGAPSVCPGTEGCRRLQHLQQQEDATVPAKRTNGSLEMYIWGAFTPFCLALHLPVRILMYHPV